MGFLLYLKERVFGIIALLVGAALIFFSTATKINGEPTNPIIAMVLFILGLVFCAYFFYAWKYGDYGTVVTKIRAGTKVFITNRPNPPGFQGSHYKGRHHGGRRYGKRWHRRR